MQKRMPILCHDEILGAEVFSELGIVHIGVVARSVDISVSSPFDQPQRSSILLRSYVWNGLELLGQSRRY